MVQHQGSINKFAVNWGGGAAGSVQVYGGRLFHLRATDKVITKKIESLIEVEIIQILFYICKFGWVNLNLFNITVFQNSVLDIVGYFDELHCMLLIIRDLRSARRAKIYMAEKPSDQDLPDQTESNVAEEGKLEDKKVSR